LPADLDDTDKSALAELLRQVIAADPYPLSPRIKTLREILDKLAPPEANPSAKRRSKQPGREARG
jgi:hypothetical protein